MPEEIEQAPGAPAEGSADPTAGAAGQQGETKPTDEESGWDEKTKAYIAKLRGESAQHRTRNKELISDVQAEKKRVKDILKAAGIEDESEKPEEKIKSLSQTSQTLAFRNAILESAVHNAIPAESLEYYEYLLAKSTGELEEGEELSESAMAEIVQKVKKVGQAPANSSVGTKPGTTPQPGSSDAISLDDFCKMSITEKSTLFLKNQALYAQLSAEARQKKRLV